MKKIPPESLLAAEYFSRLSQNPEKIRPLLEFLFALFSQGHTAYPLVALQEAWEDFTTQETEGEKNPPEPDWKALEEEVALFGPSERMAPFVLDSRLITLRQLFEKEYLLAGRLIQLKNRKIPDWQVDTRVPRFSALEELQRRAVETALGQGVFVLSGGPGTGKTFTLTHILLQYLLQSPGKEVALLAPTGRAADRIGMSLGAEISRPEYDGWEPEILDHLRNLRPMTIHRFLGEIHQSGKPHAGVVVVDESSMADLHRLTDLTGALDLSRAHLILSGDKDQLPSVENGAILADLTRDKGKPPLPTVILTRCFRAGDALVDISRGLVGFESAKLSFEEFRRALSRGKLDWCPLPPEDHPAGRAELKEVLNRETEELKSILPSAADCRLESPLGSWLEDKQALRTTTHFQALESRVFLCAGRYGILGTRELNAHMAKICGLAAFGPGTPVLVNRNHRDLGVFNGDRGLVYGAPDRTFWVLIPRQGGFQVLPLGVLKPFLEPAWAITIHKSQGSEYGEVRVFLSSGTETLLTREILYTGITRARKSALVLASEGAIKSAFSRDAQRHTGLVEALLRVQADSGAPP